MSQQILQFENFEVHIERKKIKNMYLRIKPSGEIVVSAHPKVELRTIKEFIRVKEAWILQKKEYISRQNPVINNDEIRYLGQSFKKRRLASNQVSFSIKDQILRQELPPSMSDEKANCLYEAWLQKQLEHIILSYMRRYWSYFDSLGIRPVEVKYRLMTSTWGVCRPVRGCITFNKRLIHEKESFIEYVVVHELCHLIHPNHSSKFYELVESLLPSWRIVSKR